MLALSIASLITLVAFASLLTLVDCWIRGRYEWVRIGQDRALFDTGFDTGFEPIDTALQARTRPAVRFEALATPARLPALRAVPDHRCAPDHRRAKARARVPGAA